MAVENYAPGKIKPILYYENSKGYIMMLPSDEETKKFRRHMGRLGFELMAAETLQQAESLQKRLQEQMRREQQQELAKDERMTFARRQQVRDRLVARLNSSNTSEFEKEYIRCYLAWRENKHEIFRKKFTSEVGHLDALEFDNPSQRVSELHDRVK